MAEYKKPKKQTKKQSKKTKPKKAETVEQKQRRLALEFKRRNDREELRIKAREREKEMQRMEIAKEARGVTFYDFEDSDKVIFGELGPPRGTLKIDKRGRYVEVDPKK